jgi:hypothetical protein
VSDLQRLLRDSCRDGSFKRRGLEACHHIVRRNTNRIVHAAFDALFDNQQKQSSSLWRNPVIAPDPKRTLFELVCASDLAYTTCPPATVDVFILPDEELWRLTDEELLEQKRRREAMRRGTTSTVADPIGDAVASNVAAAAAGAAAAGATADNFTAAAAAPRPKPRWAEHHEYATAVDEPVDFDDDDSDEVAREHHEDSEAINKVFESDNVIHYHDEL